MDQRITLLEARWHLNHVVLPRGRQICHRRPIKSPTHRSHRIRRRIAQRKPISQERRKVARPPSLPVRGRKLTPSAELPREEIDALVDRAKAGDRGAFSKLYVTFRPRVFALALHLTASTSDAEDITQEVFVAAYSKLAGFEGRSQFFTWLYRITVNRALNHKRKHGRQIAVDNNDPRLETAAQIDSHGHPRRAAELRQTYRRLLTAFDELSDSLKTTIVLTTLQGLSHEEAAVVLKVSPGTISWRVHEARKQMRSRLDCHDVAFSRQSKQKISSNLQVDEIDFLALAMNCIAR